MADTIFLFLIAMNVSLMNVILTRIAVALEKQGGGNG